MEGSEQSPIVFIYTCPSGSKIKERMVYASTKQGFLASMSSDMGVEIAKKVGKVERDHGAMAIMTDIKFLARGLQSFRDHCFNFRRRIPPKTGAEAGLFKTQEAWEEVSGMPIPA